MPKQLERVKIKRTIDALRRTPLTWTELKSETGLPDKSLARVLVQYLQFWDLVEKVKDSEGREKWTWKENVKIYRTVREYENDLQHSKKIAHGLFSILAEDRALGFRYTENWVHEETGKWIPSEQMIQLQQFVLEHLQSGYPETYELVSEFRRTLKEVNDFVETVVQKYKTDIIGHCADDPTRARYLIDDWKGSFDKLILSKVNASFSLPLGFLQGENRIDFLPKGILNKIDTLQKKRCDLFEDLSVRLGRLRLRVDVGRPFEGFCEICPRVSILHEGHEPRK